MLLAFSPGTAWSTRSQSDCAAFSAWVTALFSTELLALMNFGTKIQMMTARIITIRIRTVTLPLLFRVRFSVLGGMVSVYHPSAEYTTIPPMISARAVSL